MGSTSYRGSTALALWLLLPVGAILAQETPLAAAPEGQGEILTNAAVIELHQLGLGEEVIIEKIKSSTCAFDVSLEGMKALKAAGIPGSIISEMIRASKRSREEAAAAAASTETAADQDDPLAPHEAGIYLYEQTDGVGKMTQLEPTVYTQSKSGGFFKSALTYGIAKVKSKAVLKGAHAQLQIATRKPTFYFYFEVTSSGLSGSGIPYFSAASSANEFVLVKTDVQEKKNARELVVGEFNAFKAEGGVQDEAVRDFTFEKIKPGVYKVVPKADLEPGEYCFFYGGSAPVATYGLAGPAGGGKVFDFGIRGK